MDPIMPKQKSEKPFSFSADFVEKYHPLTSGSAAGIHEVAGRLNQDINEILKILRSGDFDKKVIADSQVRLERMKEEFTPSIIQFGKEINQVEKGQTFDRMLAIIAVLVAVVGIFFPLIFL